MLSWLGANIGTIAVCIVLLVIVGAIIASMIRDKKAGKSPTCGGNCGHCSMGCAGCSACHGAAVNGKAQNTGR